MTRILAITTHATDNPTKATLPFALALGAVDAKKEIGIVLIGEGTYLAKSVIAGSIQGVGFSPLAEMIQQTVEAGVPVYV